MKVLISLACMCVLTFIAVSCNDEIVEPCMTAEDGEIFEAKLHDTWCLEGEDLAITLDGIISDSRCNVQGIVCIWPGQFIMGVTIDYQGEVTRDTFYAAHSWQDTLTIGTHQIGLIKVYPEERISFDVPDDQYRFDMLFD